METTTHGDYAISTDDDNPTTAIHTQQPLQNNPSSPPSKLRKIKNGIFFWLHECVWPGLGLFGESYLLFSVGTLKPLWEKLYPYCFSGESCSDAVLHSMTYAVVIGVICGMIIIGFLANSLGRRVGSIVTASLMAFGALGLVVCSVFLWQDAEWLFVYMSCFLFVFGVGVGGEYPLSASSASERSMMEMRERAKLEALLNEQGVASPKKQQKKEARGKRVLLVFTMQGMGILLNALTLTLLLYIYNPNGLQSDEEYTNQDLLSIWRIVYAIGAIVLVYVLVSRIMFLQESSVWMENKKHRERMEKREMEVGKNGTEYNDEEKTIEMTSVKRESNEGVVPIPNDASSPSVTNYQAWDDDNGIDIKKDQTKLSSSKLLFRKYGIRLLGTSLAWLLWDVAFYGNKLFQSSFLVALTGEETTLLELSGAATLNAIVALLGYFAAAFIVDNPNIGRLKLQEIGFLLTGILFILCGFLFHRLSSGWLVVIYFGSSFFGQCGPNATTFLIPAEVFPTEMRTICHGISASAGKVGALLAAICFNYVEETNLFFISGYTSFVACMITFISIPETTTLDLYEIDKKWQMAVEGRSQEYRGDANDPTYLSVYERRKARLRP